MHNFLTHQYLGAPYWAYGALALLLVVEFLLGKFHPKSKSTLALVAATLKLAAYGASWLLAKFPPTAALGEVLKQLFGAALVLCLLTGVAGCGSAMTDTLKAEDALAVTSSVVAHTADGVDSMLEARTRSMMTDKAAAQKFYARYKPKIEKARAAVHTAQDVVGDVEAVRSRIPSKDGGTCASGCTGVATDLTAWLPALGQAMTTLQSVYADVKGLVQ